MVNWFGKGCEHQCNQWEGSEYTEGPNYRESEPVLIFCNHKNNILDSEGNCSRDICPINLKERMINGNNKC